MSKRRAGWRAAERTYKHLTGQLAKAAKSERERNLEAALRLCAAEIRQFHGSAYPGCQGGCPAHEALAEADRVLSR